MSGTARRFVLADERGAAVRHVDGLDVDLRRMTGKVGLLAPAVGRAEQFGPCGVSVRLYGRSSVCDGTVIVTQAEHDGVEWIHASIARENRMPSYSDLVRLKDAVFGPDRFAFQVFPAASQHVNIHPRALHLWGRADGSSPLPLFGEHGSI